MALYTSFGNARNQPAYVNALTGRPRLHAFWLPDDVLEEGALHLFTCDVPANEVRRTFRHLVEGPPAPDSSHPVLPLVLSPTLPFVVPSPSQVPSPPLEGGTTWPQFPSFPSWNQAVPPGHKRMQVSTPCYSVYGVPLPSGDRSSAERCIASHLSLDICWILFSWLSARHVLLKWRQLPAIVPLIERLTDLTTQIMAGCATRKATNTRTAIIGARSSRKHGVTALTARQAKQTMIVELNAILTGALPGLRWACAGLLLGGSIPVHNDPLNCAGPHTHVFSL
eukprot:2297593-Amphidinium_carterae.1